MSQHVVWELFGSSIVAYPARTLAAYLGDPECQMLLHADGAASLTSKDFLSDPVFNPNPHQLDVPLDHQETILLASSLAVWGPQVLLRASWSCANVQVDNKVDCRADLVLARDECMNAVAAYIDSEVKKDNLAVARALSHCRDLYAPYEDDPDCAAGQSVWYSLGAPWFASETAGQDFRLQEYDGSGPRESSPSWCRRNVVWVVRAASAAAKWSSDHLVRESIKRSLIEYAKKSGSGG